MIHIAPATTAEDYRQAQVLIRAYEQWLGIDLSFQDFEQELAGLEAMYGPPAGRLLLAREGREAVGCVGLRRLDEGTCEMKRMFVQPGHQGQGAGALLLAGFMAAAAQLGYRAVRLDTIPRLDRALHLYRKAGFRAIAPYRYNPDPDAVFMELEVADWLENLAPGAGRQRPGQRA